MPYPTNEELAKLNQMLSKAFSNKPASFWYARDLEGLWFYYVRVEAYEGTDNDADDPSGFSITYYSIQDLDREILIGDFLKEMWSGKDMSKEYIEDFMDGEWLGESFKETEKELEILIAKARKGRHIYT